MPFFLSHLLPISFWRDHFFENQFILSNLRQYYILKIGVLLLTICPLSMFWNPYFRKTLMSDKENIPPKTSSNSQARYTRVLAVVERIEALILETAKCQDPAVLDGTFEGYLLAGPIKMCRQIVANGGQFPDPASRLAHRCVREFDGREGEYSKQLIDLLTEFDDLFIDKTNMNIIYL